MYLARSSNGRVEQKQTPEALRSGSSFCILVLTVVLAEKKSPEVAAANSASEMREIAI